MRVARLDVHQTYRASRTRITRPFTRVVFLDPGFDVSRHSSIEGPISALDNIEIPH
jgi:hypothetical protein